MLPWYRYAMVLFRDRYDPVVFLSSACPSFVREIRSQAMCLLGSRAVEALAHLAAVGHQKHLKTSAEDDHRLEPNQIKQLRGRLLLRHFRPPKQRFDVCAERGLEFELNPTPFGTRCRIRGLKSANDFTATLL